MSRKLPYISDKKLYAAVMGACSWIRETGYFNKATQYYADEYGVDVEEVRKYVRIAQGNGQKKAPKRKYKWYVVLYLNDYRTVYEDDCEFESWNWNETEILKHSNFKLIKATSQENAEIALTKNNSIEHSGRHIIVEHCFEFETESKAVEYAKSLKWEDVKKYYIGGSNNESKS